MHAPIRVERPFSFVGGIGVKTISSGRSIIDQRAVIDGVHFKNSASSSVELVTVGTKATNQTCGLSLEIACLKGLRDLMLQSGYG